MTCADNAILNGTRWLRLSIPPEKERDLKRKVKRLCGYTQIPELDLFMSVNALMRGWANYFRYANNATKRFCYLTGVVYWLVAHYLGRKHRCSYQKVMRTSYGVDPASGKRALYTRQRGQTGIHLEQTTTNEAPFSAGRWEPKISSRYR